MPYQGPICFSETVTIYVTFALRVDSFFVQKEDSCIDDINAKLEKECPVRLYTLCLVQPSALDNQCLFCTTAIFHDMNFDHRSKYVSMLFVLC